MSGVRLLCMSLMITLWGVPSLAQVQAGATENPSPCTGSGPQPTQSGIWQVAFCNRTGHDLVIEFRDNDCPAEHWSHRGDVYRRNLRREETAIFSLCYASEAHAAQTLAPGTPQLRIPGGRGVVTSWSVVGDCGQRSDHLNLDARTFYDRGDYSSGIILLQYPSSAAHCIGTAGAADQVPETQRPSPATSPATPAAPAPVARATAPSPSSPSASAKPSASKAAEVNPTSAAKPSSVETAALPATAPGQTATRTGVAPTLHARLDPKDPVSRSVQVLATNNAGEPAYRCNFMLALSFTDGGSYVDRVKAADVASDVHDSLIVTRKYLKSVSNVTLTKLQCSSP